MATAAPPTVVARKRLRREFSLPTDTSALGRDDLKRLTNQLLDQIERLLRGCGDADVTFEPVDPQAYDPGAASHEDAHRPWTAAHIIVHTTATAEEMAALAAELARGVAYHGRSRAEVPWQSVTTVAQCRARLAESRRLRLASLGMWPERPHLELHFAFEEGAPERNVVECFLLGLRHEAAHLEQLRDAIAQARTHRRRQTRWARLLRWWQARFHRREAQSDESRAAE